MSTRCTRCGGARFWVSGCVNCDPSPASEIAHLKAELAEARYALREIEKVQYWATREIARDFLAKHPEPDPPS